MQMQSRPNELVILLLLILNYKNWNSRLKLSVSMGHKICVTLEESN